MEHVPADTAPPSSPAPLSIETRASDLVRLGIIALFIYWSIRLIAPFAVIAIWAAILAIALFPLFEMLSKLFGGRRIPAATLIVVACLLLIIAPLALVATNFADAAHGVIARLESGNFTLPSAPEGLRDWPVVGEYLYTAWNQTANNLAAALVKFKEPLLQVAGKLIVWLASIGGGVLSFMASIVFCGVLMAMGPRLGSGVMMIARRLAGEKGIGFAKLAGATVRNVSRGVIGVALLQALLCGLIFVVFDLPARGALTFLVFMLCLMQIGPALILIPVIIWAWFSWSFLMALVFTVVLIPVMLIDNILKPILISRGLSTPMPVILIGVIGGTLSYGLIGLFLGPIVLSVFYELLQAWVWDAPPPDQLQREAGPQPMAAQGEGAQP
ncbi:AI-2E family transporter [Rhizobium sp. BK251]|uniref:AI-2E family transporter n=1 Tax=Rhizobium sp. BK251 TaxID=2512125 RepID=UPI00105090C4|nr:AI-2E family transporter [Rhizobium sp. BK251]